MKHRLSKNLVKYKNNIYFNKKKKIYLSDGTGYIFLTMRTFAMDSAEDNMIPGICL